MAREVSTLAATGNQLPRSGSLEHLNTWLGLVVVSFMMASATMPSEQRF